VSPAISPPFFAILLLSQSLGLFSLPYSGVVASANILTQAPDFCQLSRGFFL